MLYTIEPQLIDAKNQIYKNVIMQVCNRRDDEANQMVSFEVKYFYIVETSKTTKDQYGNDCIIHQKQLVNYYNEQIVYKSSTYYNYFSSVTPIDYDVNFKSEILRVNSIEWTGDELTKVRYWDLTDENISFLSQEDLTLMLQTTLEVLPPVEEPPIEEQND